MTLPLGFLGLPGGSEIYLIAFVALLLFGNRLPGVMKSLGKSVTEFKKGVAGIEDDISTATTADAKPASTVPPTTSTTQPTTHA
jgi:sec-independent protein translocase protein TatA